MNLKKRTEHPRVVSGAIGGSIVTVGLWVFGVSPPTEVTGSLVTLASYLCSLLPSGE